MHLYYYAVILAAAVAPLRFTHAHDLMDTLLDEFLVLNGERATAVAALGKNASGWKLRQTMTAEHLAKLFYPLPTTPVPMPFNVTGSIHHPSGFTIKKILYQTRQVNWNRSERCVCV